MQQPQNFPGSTEDFIVVMQSISHETFVEVLSLVVSEKQI
jgi:hypothetical protein